MINCGWPMAVHHIDRRDPLGEAQLEIKALKKLQRLLDSGEQP